MRIKTHATTFTIAIAAAALSAAAATYIARTPTAPAPPEPTPAAPPVVATELASGASCTHISTEAQAQALLLRLFPKAKFVSAEPLSSSNSKSSCLLEVEMLVDGSKPETKGFVYVLPDGEHFLNGPLMDKRSRVSPDSSTADIKQALQDQQDTLKSILAPASPTASAASQSPAKGDTVYSSQLADSFPKPTRTEEIPTPEQMRKRLLEKLQTLPALTTGSGSSQVYVMYDPLCGHCKRLYKESEELSATHGIQFKWIPMFLNESSWAMSALVMKHMKDSPQHADSIFSQMMIGKWGGPDAESAIRALTEEDYAAVKPATGIFVELAKSNSRIGTPLVVYKTAAGSVDVISGVPTEDDWASLSVTP